MSIDHISTSVSPIADVPPPTFLSVKAGDYVIINAAQQLALQPTEDWWMGQVVFCEGGARNPQVHTMFQVANVDDGCISWVNADEVSHIVRSLDGLQLQD